MKLVLKKSLVDPIFLVNNISMVKNLNINRPIAIINVHKSPIIPKTKLIVTLAF